METLTVKYWHKLFFGGAGKEEKPCSKKDYVKTVEEKETGKLHGKIIDYRRNRKPELF